MFRQDRIEWSEWRVQDDGSPDRISTVAEKTHDAWRFFEKGMWDTCWYELSATPELISKAQKAWRAEENHRQYASDVVSGGPNLG
jgi:hypothetical protein